MLTTRYPQPYTGGFRDSLSPPPSPSNLPVDDHNDGGSLQSGGVAGGSAPVQQYRSSFHTKRRKLSGDGRMNGCYGAFQPAADSSFHGSQVSAQDSFEPRDQDYQAYNYLQSYDQRSSPTHSRGPTRQASPVQFEKPAQANQHPSRGRPAIASYLILPQEISNGLPGSLAEFASDITCLFWFETASVLSMVEKAPQCPHPTTRMREEAIPATGFIKWVTTLLTTTMVSTSVVILAMGFIHRLKKHNPQVQGRVGSEYRLLTVALMLGNKFLDDNTYTNKTWAEVSGISVHEIHTMEVEFLSHMKYNLYTSKDQWKDWYFQLNKYWTYFKEASQLPVGSTRLPNLQIPSLYPTLPSPPDSTSDSSPYPSMSALPPQLAQTSISPASSTRPQYEQTPSRKRSWDEAAQEPAPKRQHVPQPPSVRSQPQRNPSSRVTPLPSLPSLPLPHLPLPGHQSQALSAQDTYQYQQVLPPLQDYHQSNSNGRILPMALPQPANWLSGLPQDSMSQHPRSMAYALSSSRASARSSHNHTPVTGYQAMQPLDGQGQGSPTHYLNRRSSPYRPVRNISQLTQAPPSKDMFEYPRQVSHDQMHWYPLKKNVDEDERRTGRVPYYYDTTYGWPTGQQPDNFWPNYNSTYASMPIREQ